MLTQWLKLKELDWIHYSTGLKKINITILCRGMEERKVCLLHPSQAGLFFASVAKTSFSVMNF